MSTAEPATTTSSSSPAEEEVIHDCIIVGAGISGLTAAYELSKQGKDVIVIEAQERVGGRLHTVIVDQKFNVDVGGQWIGPTQQRVHRLLNELELTSYKQNVLGKSVWQTYAKGGNNKKAASYTYEGIIPPLSIPQLLDLQLGLWDMDAKAKTVPLDQPWKCPKAREYDSMTVQTYMESKFWTAEAKRSIVALVNAVFAAEPAEISFLFFLFYVQSAGGVNLLIETVGGAQDSKIKGGAQQIPIKLAQRVGMEKVVLNSPVQEVIQDDVTGVTVRIRNSSKVYKAKYLILALPPALCSRIAYAPPMPAARDQLTQRMPLAHVIKTTVLFKNAWYREKGYCGFFGSGIQEPEYPIQAGFDFTSDPGIVGFILGDKAKYWSRRTQEERLTAILKQYAELFDVTEEFLRTELLEYKDKDWAAEEYNRGAYMSFTGPGTLTSGVADTLCAPIGRIHFAGTETATEWNGYMDGAIQAAYRAAEEVKARL